MTATEVEYRKPIPRPYQVRAKDNFLAGGKSGIIKLPTGCGKCLGKGTPVLMHDGSVKSVEDVAVGDLLMGPDSLPRRVESLARGREAMYRVVPRKGEPFVVNESHVLSLKMTPGATKGSGKRGSIYTAGTLINLSVADYLSRSNTFKHCAKGWRAGVDFPHTDVPLDPYYLGLWLADGSKDNPVVYKPDDEVRDACAEVAESVGCRLVRYKNHASDCPGWAISAGERYEFKSNPVREKLQAIGVLGNKHLPQSYKVNSRPVRLAVLAGILDGDGHLVQDGCSYDFIAKEESFSRDVAFLARSLGLAAYVKRCVKTCQNDFSGVYWRVSISGNTDEIPCRIARKKAAPRQQKKDVLKFGFTLEPIGEGDYYGFNLDGPDRLFLLGDFTVTHNSITSAIIADEYPGERILFLAPTSALVYQTCQTFMRCGLWPNVEKADEYKGGPYLPDQRERKKMFPLGFPPHEWFRFDRVWVSTIQTFKDRVEKYREGGFDLVVGDECHRILAKSWLNTIDRLRRFNPSVLVCGLSATPNRGDKRSLAELFPGRVTDKGVEPHYAYRMEIAEAIGDGYLVDVEPERAVLAGVDESMWKMGNSRSGGRDLTDESVEASMNNKVCIESIAHEVLERSGQRKGIVFLPGVAVTESVCAAMNELRPGCAVFAHGGVPKREVRKRMRMIEDSRCREGEPQFILGCDMLIEGYDCPDIAVVVMARFTAQRGRFEQMLGRGLRVIASSIEGKHTAAERLAGIAASSKPTCRLIDFANNSRFKLVGIEDILLGNDGSKEAKKKAEYVRKHRDENDRRALRDQLEVLESIYALEEAARQGGGIPAKADFNYHHVDLFADGRVTRREQFTSKADAKRPTGEMVRQAIDLMIPAERAEGMSQGELRAAIERQKEVKCGRRNFGFLVGGCKIPKEVVNELRLNWHDATYLRNLLRAQRRDALPDNWRELVANNRRERATGRK